MLYFEGEQHHSHRIVRAVKNRFGAVSELGVFEMTGTGLRAVPNPSQLFLAERPADAPGSAVLCCIEGTRPMLVEVQALVSTSSVRQRPADGQRHRSEPALAAAGGAREARGLNLMGEDVFVNVAGGMSRRRAGRAISPSWRRGVERPQPSVKRAPWCSAKSASPARYAASAQAALRVREAAQMGFTRCIVAHGNCAPEEVPEALEVVTVKTVGEALDQIMDW